MAATSEKTTTPGLIRTQRPSAPREPSPARREIQRLTYSNGDVYHGELLGGLRDGFGTLSSKLKDPPALNYSYSGQWVRGLRHGFGVESIGDYQYVGEWVEDNRSGYGALAFPGGQYVGQFEKNKYEGFGRLEMEDGQYTEGLWSNDKIANGITRIAANNISYEGPLLTSPTTGKIELSGIAKIHYADGGIYEGRVVDSQRNGLGTFRFPDGDFQSGLWADGEFIEGDMRIIFPDQGVYRCKWDGGFQGTGTVFHLDGRVSTGEWVKGKREGVWEVCYPSGDIVAIRYKNGKRAGRPKRKYSALPHEYDSKTTSQSCGVCLKQHNAKTSACGNKAHLICCECRAKVNMCPFCRQLRIPEALH